MGSGVPVKVLRGININTFSSFPTHNSFSKLDYKMRYTLCKTISGYWPKSFIFHSSTRRVAFAVSSLVARTRKHGYMILKLEFRCYRADKLEHTLCHIYFRFMAAIFVYPVIFRSDIVLFSSAMLPDSENMGNCGRNLVAFSCVR